MFVLHTLLLHQRDIFQLESEMKKKTFFVGFFFCRLCSKLWITIAQPSEQ